VTPPKRDKGKGVNGPTDDFYGIFIRSISPVRSNSYTKSDTYTRSCNFAALDASQGFSGRLARPLAQPQGPESLMMDIVMLAIGAIFFALSIAYVYACDLL
jgi:hypothetical protein